MSENQSDNKAASKISPFDDTPDQILWKDRKRILGMPISFTRYEVDINRLTSRIGLLRTVTNEILLYRILDLKMSRTLGQKIFGVGTIVLYTADQTDNQFPLVNIKNPEKIRRFLSKLVEQERNQRRIAGREMFGVAGAGMTDIDGDGIPD
ncbi:MAG: PH domain-containing protein [Clostridiaceae bacterium]|nr:PH domain-containing protein [Clostridiaceae bacterium]